jgi:hypothetical protein
MKYWQKFYRRLYAHPYSLQFQSVGTSTTITFSMQLEKKDYVEGCMLHQVFVKVDS